MRIINKILKMNKIYALKDPITKDIKYIGQTSLTLYRRLTRHVSESLTKKEETPKRKWIKELINKELCPFIELIEVTDSPNERELYWMKKHKNTILNSEDIVKYSKPNSKKVYALCTASGKILTFKNAKEASIITNTPQENLVKAIYSGGNANGYMWSYFSKFEVKYKNLPVKIILTKIENGEKFIFWTKKEAIEYIGGNVISNKNGANYALKHDNKEYKGYYWDYARELVKLDELLEDCDVNQQPSLSNSENKVDRKVQRLTVEESDTNNTDTSVEQELDSYSVPLPNEIGITKMHTYGELILDDIVRTTLNKEDVESKDKEP